MEGLGQIELGEGVNISTPLSKVHATHSDTRNQTDSKRPMKPGAQLAESRNRRCKRQKMTASVETF
jgi:hypothetical protein